MASRSAAHVLAVISLFIGMLGLNLLLRSELRSRRSLHQPPDQPPHQPPALLSASASWCHWLDQDQPQEPHDELSSELKLLCTALLLELRLRAVFLVLELRSGGILWVLELRFDAVGKAETYRDPRSKPVLNPNLYAFYPSDASEGALFEPTTPGSWHCAACISRQ
eukprot:gnl/MRDRNA2_/MRDRNA2_222742_c0_seq1.p1 gnl/MRDRNA2_/MRDRNA2_222742_c0~~gnl/MRDRNA2_/MRDRNA2_222742_c0_seq1.p1  ORF type:complete len:166 (-),score=16.79 gnl/MRDRNA2_/MRDRNA2_222742_c0_seq1:36-533(-)